MVWQECKVARAAQQTAQFLSLTVCLVVVTTAGAQSVNSKAKPPVEKAGGNGTLVGSNPASRAPLVTVKQPPAERRFLDGVLMTVDSRVILFSEVLDDFESIQSGLVEANQGKPLTLRRQRKIKNETMRKFQERAVKASAALTLPSSTPEQIAAYVERVLQAEKQDLINQYGSLAKMKEEMSRAGSSTFMIERNQRESILLNLARQELFMRLRDRRALMITPKMLRDHYRKMVGSRRTGSVSDFARVVIGIEQAENTAPALEKARQVIAAWRNSDLSAVELAKKFGGIAIENKSLTLENIEKLDPFIARFIGKAKTGDVSESHVHISGVVVIKVLRRQAGNDYRWDDPMVQEQMRAELLAVEIRKLQLRNAMRDWDKVNLWTSPLARRL